METGNERWKGMRKGKGELDKEKYELRTSEKMEGDTFSLIY